MGDDVVGAVRLSAWPERVGLRADVDEVDLDDVGVAVAPACANESGTRGRLEVDDRVRTAGQELGRPRKPCCRGAGLDRGHL